MKQVCNGLKSKREMLEETLDEYREMFVRTRQGFAVLADVRFLPTFTFQLFHSTLFFD